jgi:hypothetical protein
LFWTRYLSDEICHENASTVYSIYEISVELHGQVFKCCKLKPSQRNREFYVCSTVCIHFVTTEEQNIETSLFLVNNQKVNRLNADNRIPHSTQAELKQEVSWL